MKNYISIKAEQHQEGREKMRNMVRDILNKSRTQLKRPRKNDNRVRVTSSLDLIGQ